MTAEDMSGMFISVTAFPEVTVLILLLTRWRLPTTLPGSKTPIRILSAEFWKRAAGHLYCLRKAPAEDCVTTGDYLNGVWGLRALYAANG